MGIADKLLVTALHIEEAGKQVFSAEDLVVRAWGEFPDAFGLQGYYDGNGNAIYPNSNRVYAEIMGSKPLRKQGLLQKVGNKMYRLTEAGRVRAKRVENTAGAKTEGKWVLGREQVDQIKRLFESKAAQKHRAGNLDEVTFFDACGFWGISPRSGAKDLWSRFASIESVLDAGVAALGERTAASAKHGAEVYSENALNGLKEFHRILQHKFQHEIEVIQTRRDERRL
ncbi:MAG: hypothetical protein JSV16_07705 [Candidatus Hydrogenedentota bacterium]|nr:MAG: hypothetical protein JSV16_07705 [Candidatus Hydrogenedentota bacterium]